MNQHSQPGPLDQVLLTEDQLLPSSGFAASVMDRIEAESAAPAPIPFPWKRTLPGLAALLASLYFFYRMASAAFVQIGDSSVSTGWMQWLQSSAPAAVALRTQAAPALLAIAGAWLCAAICGRFARGWSAH